MVFGGLVDEESMQHPNKIRFDVVEGENKRGCTSVIYVVKVQFSEPHRTKIFQKKSFLTKSGTQRTE